MIKKILFKVLMILSALIGVLLQMFASSVDFMGGPSMLLYFTIQSNIAVAIIGVITLIYEIKGKEISDRLYLAKFIANIAIILTFLVFNLLLAPNIHVGYLLSPSNIMVHTLTAVFSMIDYLLNDKPLEVKKLTLYGLIGPLCYLFFAYIMYFSNVKFSGADFPYFFLDFNQNGWFTIGDTLGIVYWWIIILLIVFGISYSSIKLKKSIWNQKTIVVGSMMLLITLTITILKMLG